ncbi:hypothetical protein O181_087720 [Austropuccinia psidii MF-1]|uniref:Uncharacterized protein n=1 Tax=Austropuccinia psidii MF-1 TaxID=1389203 RepID=A0A9Q3IQF0_9BASI|nr:hypothetical protein [Austropuccinia psidii MF-1]
MGPLVPFWPRSNEAKRGQGGSSSAPNHKWAHLSQFWPQKPTNPEIAKNTLGPENWPQFSPLPLETTRGHQISYNEGFPSVSGEEISFLNAPHTPGSRSGAYMV